LTIAGKEGDVVLAQQPASAAPPVMPRVGEGAARSLEVGVEGEGGSGWAALGARRHDVLVGAARDARVEPAAESHVVADFAGLVEDVRGRFLHRRGQARPHLAGQARDGLAGGGPEGAVGEAREADAPASEGHAPAQAAGDEGAIGRELGGAAHGAGVVGEVAIDLVADDEQAELAGRLDHIGDERGRGERACRVIGQGEDQLARAPALSATGSDDLAQRAGVRNAAGFASDRHLQHPLAGQRGLRRVADPRRPRQYDVAG
jgi:hypothetical protein